MSAEKNPPHMWKHIAVAGHIACQSAAAATKQKPSAPAERIRTAEQTQKHTKISSQRELIFVCLYYTKLEPIFKINSRNIPQGKALTREYARALAKQESGNVLPLHSATNNLGNGGGVRNANMDEFLRNYFLGKGFAKTRLMFSTRIRISARRQGLGGNPRGLLLWEWGNIKPKILLQYN